MSRSAVACASEDDAGSRRLVRVRVRLGGLQLVAVGFELVKPAVGAAEQADHVVCLFQLSKARAENYAALGSLGLDLPQLFAGRLFIAVWQEADELVATVSEHQVFAPQAGLERPR